LHELDKRELISKVAGKTYFSFDNGVRTSRPINTALFDESGGAAKLFMEKLLHNAVTDLSSDDITSACYTIAMSFISLIDVEKQGDQKTPGTYFEYFICHLFARSFGVDPQTRINVLNLDRPASLPTDWIFDLGKGQPKFHLPVKTSTRERVIQVWAHQRVLDGVYGVGRFIGTLACLAETKLDSRTREVVEICLPDQWRIYQMFIAQLQRVYYLDVPKPYEPLSRDFPRIHVKPFGVFFHELEELCSG